ncbi:unnamed protein product [Prorocentrum cordatum]|uniref:HEAT repeat-containing protein 1 n=1 Tax=Prorocentrum cordatum TaxID=2364126 RepID=A0ABN9T797_9DINO|nr:unnamed protein product [Polarella glacialis]
MDGQCLGAQLRGARQAQPSAKLATQQHTDVAIRPQAALRKLSKATDTCHEFPKFLQLLSPMVLPQALLPPPPQQTEFEGRSSEDGDILQRAVAEKRVFEEQFQALGFKGPRVECRTSRGPQSQCLDTSFRGVRNPSPRQTLRHLHVDLTFSIEIAKPLFSSVMACLMLLLYARMGLDQVPRVTTASHVQLACLATASRAARLRSAPVVRILQVPQPLVGSTSPTCLAAQTAHAAKFDAVARAVLVPLLVLPMRLAMVALRLPPPMRRALLGGASFDLPDFYHFDGPGGTGARWSPSFRPTYKGGGRWSPDAPVSAAKNRVPSQCCAEWCETAHHRWAKSVRGRLRKAWRPAAVEEAPGTVSSRFDSTLACETEMLQDQQRTTTAPPIVQAQAAFLGAIGKAAEAVSSEIAGGEEASNLEALVTHAACLAKRHPDSQTTYRILLLLSTHGGVIGPALTASLRSGSDHERRAIVRVLGLLGEHVSSGGVQGELHDSPVRTKVANDAVPALTACLDDDDARVRAAAADALRLFGQRAACAVPALVEALRDPVPIVRVASARGLGLLGRAEPEREALIVALADECSDLRRAAAESLGRLCSRARCWENVPEAVPSLARCLEDADGQVRVAAAGALQKAGVHGVGAMLQLMRCLEDEHEGVREQAARALGEMGPAAAEAEQLLVGRLEDGHGAVRSAAATALGQLGERATPVLALKRCLGDGSNDVRKAAAASLGNLGAHAAAAVPALGRRLVDNDEEVRVTVALALGQLGQHASRALPALTERIKDPDINVRRAATMALVRMGPHASKASPALRELLADPSVQVREAAALVLRQASGTASRHASEPRSPCGADDAARASSDTSSDSGSGGGSSAGERSAGVSPEEDARGSAAV